mmetsp:Transcript_27489/g.53776  ORF Transcript_27489/g.53776 Transcript_27489/m.53776 type:complete len:290 (-) Transcript_27489:297-1166(-)
MEQESQRNEHAIYHIMICGCCYQQTHWTSCCGPNNRVLHRHTPSAQLIAHDLRHIFRYVGHDLHVHDDEHDLHDPEDERIPVWTINLCQAYVPERVDKVLNSIGRVDLHAAKQMLFVIAILLPLGFQTVHQRTRAFPRLDNSRFVNAVLSRRIYHCRQPGETRLVRQLVRPPREERRSKHDFTRFFLELSCKQFRRVFEMGPDETPVIFQLTIKSGHGNFVPLPVRADTLLHPNRHRNCQMKETGAKGQHVDSLNESWGCFRKIITGICRAQKSRGDSSDQRGDERIAA